MKAVLAGCIGAILFAAATLLPAQPVSIRRMSKPPDVPSESGPAREGGSSLEARLALAVADRLLASDSSDDHVRGVERLVASGERDAIDRLVRVFDGGSPVAKDPRARLAAIRALSLFLSREPVRKVFEKELMVEPGAAPLLPLVRETAAMALAASGDKASILALLQGLRQGGAAAEIATRALLAHPPNSLEAFTVARDGLPAAACAVLGQLGDQRAVPLLRAALRFERKPTADDETLGTTIEEESRIHLAAAKALARLGDQAQVAVARSWAAAPQPFQRLAGASILLLSGTADARRVLVPLLSGSTRREALELAYQSPGPELVPALAALAAGPDDWRTAVFTLGSIGGQQALATLQALLNDPARSWEAAFALARAPGDEARVALEKAQGTPRLRRLAARAGTVRALALRDAPRGLVGVLRDLMASNDPADRAAGAYGLAVLREVSMRDLMASTDLAVVRSAARAALVLGRDAAPACAARLVRERDAITRAALAVSLVSDDGARLVSTEQLSTWAEVDDPAALLAVMALGSREEPGTERRLSRMLSSIDPVRRAHAALALAQSPLESSASRLSAAWRFESNASVRRAIVAALAQRREPQRTAVLVLAARLDPDEQAREAARLGLLGQFPEAGRRLGAGCAGSAAVGGCYVWCRSYLPSKAAAASSVGGRLGRWLDSSGLALPLVTDPDGALVVAGVSPGDSSFDLASSPFWYDALQDDAAEAQPAR